MRLIAFYNKFHEKAKVQNKVINDNNFTYKPIINCLKPHIKSKNKLNILDIGCGVGTISFWLASKGLKVTGVDISTRAVELCNNSSTVLGLQKNTSFIASNIIEINQSQKFDLIICLEVLEHIDDDQKLLQKIITLLKDRGIFFLSVPSKNAPLYRIGLVDKFDKKVGHKRRYKREELSKKLENIGYKIIETRGFEGILRNFLFLNPFAEKFIKFIRGPLVNLLTYFDNFLIIVFGESNFIIVSRKGTAICT